MKIHSFLLEKVQGISNDLFLSLIKKYPSDKYINMMRELYLSDVASIYFSEDNILKVDFFKDNVKKSLKFKGIQNYSFDSEDNYPDFYLEDWGVMEHKSGFIQGCLYFSNNTLLKFCCREIEIE